MKKKLLEWKKEKKEEELHVLDGFLSFDDLVFIVISF